VIKCIDAIYRLSVDCHSCESRNPKFGLFYKDDALVKRCRCMQRLYIPNVKSNGNVTGSRLRRDTNAKLCYINYDYFHVFLVMGW
jgi:hypothetical protein